MPKRPVDNSSLARWRAMDAALALKAVADHAVKDRSFKPVLAVPSARRYREETYVRSHRCSGRSEHLADS